MSKEDIKVAITAATSRTGSEATRLLLKDGYKVRAIVHDASSPKVANLKGAEIVQASQYDPNELSKACQGIQSIYVMNIPQWGGMSMVEAAKKAGMSLKEMITKAGIRRVVVLSAAGAQFDHGTGKIVTTHILEDCLKDSAPEVIFLRAAYFLDNWKNSLKELAQSGNLITYLSPATHAIPMVATSDIGNVIAKYLIAPLPADATFPYILNLHGPQDYSPNDIALAMGKVLAKEVKVKEISDENLEEELGKVFPQQRDVWCEFYRAYNPGGIIEQDKTFSEVNVVRGKVGPLEAFS